MLRPIDTDAVIREGVAIGQFPGQIHEDVGWWLGACLVVVTKTHRLAAAHDGRPTSAEFHRRACLGATNAEHYKCEVMDLGVATEAELRAAIGALGGVPGILVTSAGTDNGETVRIVLYDGLGQPLTENSGLAQIRRRIADDRMPIPVNAAAEGMITPYPRAGQA
ncbi:hypothetical protein LO772_27635 [Yinghuangia sp. ASG 101]|uniref:hypothetical protein n=1 Tax=Yinghuangia sp. ASG 101 TaxID=2896848 RepID=UPI001E477E25|nr:hypothetical protein [Yinghuangia sp. ASG 101]UGQ10583.1 hypothetical protein LO772_27635 [Yinghuangia sp. ASG 101]